MALGRVADASTPIIPNTATPASPYQSRRMASTPMNAANTAKTSTIPACSASLSYV